jgi:serine/threonine protein kinase
MTTSTDSISIQAAKEHPLPEFAPGQQIGSYEVVRKMDEGMIGAVYKVKHSQTGEIHALKLIRPQLLPRGLDAAKFEHELQLLSQTKHDGLVQVFGSGEQDGIFFFTMEFLEGKSLRTVMNEHQARGMDIPHRRMLEVLTGVLEILNDIHPGTIHRNLKPENIILVPAKGPDGATTETIKLTDFGIARVVTFAETSLNREGAWYLAPEMSEFRDKATPSSDLYSLGAIVYEMLTGQAPIGRYELPSAIRQGEISAKVDDLVEIALEANPQDRFRNADDMLAAVDETFADLYGTGQAPLMRMLVLVGVLVVLVAVLIIQINRGKMSPEEIQAAEDDRRSSLRAEHSAQYTQPAAPTQADADRADKYDNMKWVPAGSYLRGKWRNLDGAGPEADIESKTEVAGFWIDTHEVHFPEEPPVAGESPEEASARNGRNAARAWKINSNNSEGFDFAQASTTCATRGKRLCSADEWEKACKGPGLTDYSYGNDHEPDRCAALGYLSSQPYKANQHPGCAGPWGIEGLSGGVLEWTSTKRGDGYVIKVARGSSERQSRCAASDVRDAGSSDINLGVRCCAN